MNNSQIILDQLAAGNHDNDTTAAALDALQEDTGISLLAAVIEVARVYNEAYTSRLLTKASVLLSRRSPVAKMLKREVVRECPNLSLHDLLTFVVIEGDAWPRATDTTISNADYTVTCAHISIGAEWVVKAARRLANRVPPSKRARLAKLLD